MIGQNWEKDFRVAVDVIGTTEAMDERILARARSYKPLKQQSRVTSKAASGLAALAIAVILLHPAQYLGALTPAQAASDGFASSTSTRQRLKKQVVQGQKTPTVDKWHSLRTEINAGNLAGLCAQWRREQRNAGQDMLPSDLAAKAKQHCRILP